MTYLDEFRTQINVKDYTKFLQLWEEYCTNDVVDVAEFVTFLKMVKDSDFAKPFGKLIETALPLWQMINDEDESFEVMKHLIDLENTNSPMLGEIALQLIQKRFQNDPKYNERLRLVGLRANSESFQGSLTSYELLAHMNKGKFVFHTSGWGTGEIMDISEVREQVAIEFENVQGLKHITFVNAFKTLVPLPETHFLARRFSNPDKLEEEARKDSVAIVKLLLKDLGPKTASEIKDELSELVIPEKDWSKWWSNTRSKLKKDTMIESPENLKESFFLRINEVKHEERLAKAIETLTEPNEIMMTAYNFVRDFPHMLKKPDVKESVVNKILGLQKGELSTSQELQIRLFFETMLNETNPKGTVKDYLSEIQNFSQIIDQIEILAFKKQAMTAIRENRSNWIPLFLELLETVTQATLRDYILKELNTPEARPQLEKRLQRLQDQPAENPELFVWYFQKIAVQDKEDLPFNNNEGLGTLFESFLILYNAIEQKSEYRDLLKKMYNLMAGKRFEVVRNIMQGRSEEFLKETLLLASKCQTLGDHDLKILRSLAAVVQPTLMHEGDKKKKPHTDITINWTTEAGYMRIQERCQQIGTIEIIENAREVEAARALGDLRENSEYKFACEKRSRLQGELKQLSDQLKRARIITPHDVDSSEVGIGSIVTVQDGQGKTSTYTILGAWDAEAEKGVLSLQSMLAQSMLGAKVGDTISFKDDELKITALKSFFDK